ncbi:MAG: hypothetical protein ACTSUY_12075, partial [Alphaproteobacteria bacterium]
CLLENARAQPKTTWLQHQAKIPFVAFFLKSTPTDIGAVALDRPMTKPIAAPARLLGGNKLGKGFPEPI